MRGRGKLGAHHDRSLSRGILRQAIGVVRATRLECVGVERCARLAGRKRNEHAGVNGSIAVGVEYGRLLVHSSSSYPWIGTRDLFGTAFPRVNARQEWGEGRGTHGDKW